jgi:hypothetical protein
MVTINLLIMFNRRIDEIPFGIIFASFMVSIMIGSIAFRVSVTEKWAVEKTIQRTSEHLRWLLTYISIAPFICILLGSADHVIGISVNSVCIMS